MTNQERHEKLMEAKKLIREVEFSYPIGHENRLRLYKVVVDAFSFMGSLNPVFNEIEKEIAMEIQEKDNSIIQERGISEPMKDEIRKLSKEYDKHFNKGDSNE